MKAFMLSALRVALVLLAISFVILGVEGRGTADCACGASEMSYVMLSDSPTVGDRDDDFQKWRFGWPMRAVHLYYLVAGDPDENDVMAVRVRIAPTGLAVNFAVCCVLGIAYTGIRRARRKRKMERAGKDANSPNSAAVK